MPFKRNSIKEVIAFLEKNPFRTETQIWYHVWGATRENSFCTKKYAEIIRRGLYSGKIRRMKVKFKVRFGYLNRSRYVYYLPETFSGKVGS